MTGWKCHLAKDGGTYCDIPGHCFGTPQGLASHTGHTGHQVFQDTQQQRVSSGRQEQHGLRAQRIMSGLTPGGRSLLQAILGDPKRKTAGMTKRYSLAAMGEEAVKVKLGQHLKPLNEMFVNPPVDLLDEQTKTAYEVKTFSANAKDQKVKNEKYKKGNYQGLDSRTVKQNWCDQQGYKLVTVVAVVGDDGYKLFRRDGYGNYRPSTMEVIP